MKICIKGRSSWPSPHQLLQLLWAMEILLIWLCYATMKNIFSDCIINSDWLDSIKETAEKIAQASDPGRSSAARLQTLQAVSSMAISSVTLQHQSSLLTAAMITSCNGRSLPAPNATQPLQPLQRYANTPCATATLALGHKARCLGECQKVANRFDTATPIFTGSHWAPKTCFIGAPM